jgi:hypothetical protein
MRIRHLSVRYVGEYELVPTFHIVVTREGEVLHQNGQNLTGKKIR